MRIGVSSLLRESGAFERIYDSNPQEKPFIWRCRGPLAIVSASWHLGDAEGEMTCLLGTPASVLKDEEIGWSIASVLSGCRFLLQRHLSPWQLMCPMPEWFKTNLVHSSVSKHLLQTLLYGDNGSTAYVGLEAGAVRAPPMHLASLLRGAMHLAKFLKDVSANVRRVLRMTAGADIVGTFLTPCATTFEQFGELVFACQLDLTYTLYPQIVCVDACGDAVFAADGGDDEPN